MPLALSGKAELLRIMWHFLQFKDSPSPVKM
jgi:hypothetical protein